MSEKQPTHAELVDSLREDLRSYHGLHRRTGEDLTFPRVAELHRSQCEENYRDTRDIYWRDRAAMCDEVLLGEGVPA